MTESKSQSKTQTENTVVSGSGSSIKSGIFSFGGRNKLVIVSVILVFVLLVVGAVIKQHNDNVQKAKLSSQSPTDQAYAKVQSLKKQLASDPNNKSVKSQLTSANGDLASAYVTDKKYDQAQTVYQQMSSDPSAKILALQGQAIIYINTGNKQAAIEAYQQLVTYYQSLPNDDPSKNMEIGDAQNTIKQLQAGN
jgi:Flp pilus assembly protein TadD